MNAKEKLLSVITSQFGPSSWHLFRKALSLCQDAVNGTELRKLWNDLLEKWIPLSPVTDKARNYLDTYIWQRRKYWAKAYFKNELTLGSTSTQRAESWNNLLKFFRDSTSLLDLYKSIKLLFMRQAELENKSERLEYRLGNILKHTAVYKLVTEPLKNGEFSRFSALNNIEELNESVMYRTDDDNLCTEKCDKLVGFNVSCNVKSIYNNIRTYDDSTRCDLNLSFVNDIIRGDFHFNMDVPQAS